MKILSLKKAFLILILYSFSIYGQGIISGSVIDSLTMDQLKGAEIILTGTNFSTSSNTDGEFRITGIPPGDYIVQTSYLGYEGKKYLVNVESAKTQILNIKLLPIVTAENEMTFTTQARSQAEEINLSTSSNTIRNIISRQKLQDLPDENIAIALSRLPGVSILYKPFKIPTNVLVSGGYIDDGEDQSGIMMPPQDNFSFADDQFPKVLIRGLDSKFSNITLDGVRIPLASVKDKSIDLSIFSGREFQNIDLHKAITSDEDADATAGAINIVTGNAPYKRIIKAELSCNDNSFEKSANQYNFTGNYTDRFFDNLLGAQVDVSLEKKILSNEYQSFYLMNLTSANTLSYTHSTRKNNGANILLDFITPDGGLIKFKNIYDYTNTDYFENKADSTTAVLFNMPLLIYCDRETEQKVLISSIGGNNHFFGFDVDWNAAFSESKTDNPYYYRLNFYLMPTNNQYNLDNSIDSPSKNYCKEQTASIDITKKYNISNEIIGELKFGGKYRINSRTFDEDLYAESGSLYGNGRFRELTDGSLVMKDFSSTRFDGLIGVRKSDILLSYFQDAPTDKRILFDKFEIPLISEDALRLWRQLNYNEYYFNHVEPDINSYDFAESVFAGYVMHNLNFGQWAKFITGIRIESERNNYSGYYFSDVITSAEELYNGIPQKTKTNNYDKITILPNFQMFLQPSNFLNLRMAIYKTLIRPDCSARIPKILYIVEARSNIGYLNMGNPDLKNADVWNYEFQTQFYGSIIGLFNINAFYKDIVGMQQETNAITLTNVNTVKSLGINWNSFSLSPRFPEYYNVNVYTYYNSSRPTHIWGFEIEHQANFRYLPGLLKNIVLDYNFTFLRSETWKLNVNQIYTTGPEDVISYKKLKLSYMPPFFANVILGYDLDGFSFRISYFYQDGFTNDYQRQWDTYQVKENKLSKLDIAVKQKILEKISIILNLNNITNSNEEDLYRWFFNADNPPATWKTYQAYRYGFNVTFGARVDL
jgi:hypothetical protein